MTLFKEILADTIVVVHLSYMAYAVFGQLAIVIGWACGWAWIRNPWFRLSHLAMILIVAVEAVVEFECPLTTWENALRDELGQVVVDPEAARGWDVENVSFTARLARKIMFAGSDEAFLPYLKPTYYTFAGIVLASLLLAPPRFRRQTPALNEPRPSGSGEPPGPAAP